MIEDLPKSDVKKGFTKLALVELDKKRRESILLKMGIHYITVEIVRKTFMD